LHHLIAMHDDPERADITRSAQKLRDGARRLRQLARDFPTDPAADQLRELADEIDGRASALERDA
jgi:hypothetical protein